MFASASAVSFVSITVTVLMIAAMLYLVWGSLDSDIHTATPDEPEQPELDEGDDASEPQAEIPDGSTA